MGPGAGTGPRTRAILSTAWEKIATIIGYAHKLAGASFEPSAKCKHVAKTYGRLLESDIFPEIGFAWAGPGPPKHEVLPKDERIDFLAAPSVGSAVIHTVTAPQAVQGWVGEQSKWWPPHFISKLVYSIGDNVIWKILLFF